MNSEQILKDMAMRNDRTEFFFACLLVLTVVAFLVLVASGIEPQNFVNRVIDWKKSLKDLRKRWNEEDE